MTFEATLVAAYEVERVLFRLALAALVVKLSSEAWGAWRAARTPEPGAAPLEIWPLVTVQLPLRDEYYVAERVIRAAAALDYPALEIQVLDDSDDETRDRVDAVAAELRARGVAIDVIRRAAREGAKAGALAHGLALARGEYIAVFDADFMPEPDFLRRALPRFAADPRIGMVQGRWQLVDRERSLLAQAQALVLDGLQLVEQPAKSARRQPLHFNGTAGVWRRACIDDAGGWRDVSLTEDLELSYRAARRGWRLVHVAELAVPCELPATMRAFRVQQQRWTRGNAQVLRSSWRAIATAPLPRRHRAAMLVRASARSLYVFLAILTLAMPITTFVRLPLLVDYSVASDGAILGVVLAALYAYYAPALRRATGSAWRAAYLVPVVIALHVGMSACNAGAFLAGLVRRPAPFVRTPKLGATPASGPRYALPFAACSLVELAIGAAYSALAALAVHRHLGAVAVLFAAWAAAHLWTGAASARR